MRIIAGRWRGRSIEAPQGETTRPTIDRVRESLMSSLASARGGFEGAVVLDPFAGSGALGFEALSRGASTVLFYESDRSAAKVVEKNRVKLGCDPSSAVLRVADVFAVSPTHPRTPFDLLLLDPPYETDPARVFDLLDRLDEAGALAQDAIVSYEHARACDLTEAAERARVGWRCRSHKTYGKLAVDIFVRDVGQAADGEIPLGAGEE